MRRQSAVRIAAVALVAAAAFTPRAHAYVRSSVEDDPTTHLFWRYRHQRVRPAYDTSRDVSEDAIRLAVGRSIATWNIAGELCTDFVLEDAGPPTGLATNLFGGAHDAENRIVFREDDWPDDIPPGTLALTSIVYRRASGQILDADIDMNANEYFWTDTVEPGRADTDVQNTLTHELGHLIGLAHATDPEATMYFQSGRGDLEKRTLADDDIQGLCFIYPRGRLSPEAPHLRGTRLTSGCVAGPPTGRSPALARWLAFAGLIALRRRARHRRAPALEGRLSARGSRRGV